MIKWLLKIRNRFILISLYMKIAWIRFKGRKVDRLNNRSIIYTLFILLIAFGLGLVCQSGFGSIPEYYRLTLKLGD